MHCPIHGTTLSPTEHDDVEIACPECRHAWATRGDLYELPRRGRHKRVPPGEHE